MIEIENAYDKYKEWIEEIKSRLSLKDIERFVAIGMEINNLINKVNKNDWTVEDSLKTIERIMRI